MLTKAHCFPDSTESYYCTHKCPTPERDEITQINPRTSSARSRFDISDRSCLLAKETPHGSNWAVCTDEKGLALCVGMVFDSWLPLLAMTSSTVHSRGAFGCSALISTVLQCGYMCILNQSRLISETCQKFISLSKFQLHTDKGKKKKKTSGLECVKEHTGLSSKPRPGTASTSQLKC